MLDVISNGVIEDEERPGWTRACQSCKKDIRYTILNINSGEDIFLYSNKTSDFILRSEDFLSAKKFNKNSAQKKLENIEDLYKELESQLPPCPGGGFFNIWSNIKCPHCHYEFPYNNGEKDKTMRFLESKIIWIEGAIAYRGGNDNSNRLKSVTVT